MNEQIKGAVERVVTIAATWALTQAASHGWISQADIVTLLPAIVLLPSLAWGWWINRPQALVAAAAQTVNPDTGEKTKIITSPEIAAATPDLPNVVSSTENKVVPK